MSRADKIATWLTKRGYAEQEVPSNAAFRRFTKTDTDDITDQSVEIMCLVHHEGSYVYLLGADRRRDATVVTDLIQPNTPAFSNCEQRVLTTLHFWEAQDNDQ